MFIYLKGWVGNNFLNVEKCDVVKFFLFILLLSCVIDVIVLLLDSLVYIFVGVWYLG